MSKLVTKRVEAIREELSKPIPEHLAQKEKPMAERKSSAKKKAAPKKKAAAKKKPAAKKAAAKDDNVVTLADLADEAGISGQAARQKLRNAEIERPEGKRWGWTSKSKELTKVRKALGI